MFRRIELIVLFFLVLVPLFGCRSTPWRSELDRSASVAPAGVVSPGKSCH